MKTQSLISTALLLGSTLAGATSAAAAPHTGVAAADTIKACYVKGSGTVYRVKAPNTPTQCADGHVEFHVGATAPTTVSGNSAQATSADDPYPQYLIKDGARDARDGFAVTGTRNQGGIPATGEGTRLMWYPKKAAFRAGFVHGEHWDDTSAETTIGLWSTAMGASTRAIGRASTAIGQETYARGDWSTAIGQSARALGNHSTAIGFRTLAGGRSATAIGHETRAEVDYSTALGFKTVATGEGATALGANTSAGGARSLAGGEGSSAAQYATAIGFYTRAGGVASTALGYRTAARGHRSTALGSYASDNMTQGTFIYGDASTSYEVRAARDNQFVVRAQHFWLGRTNAVTSNTGRLIETSTGAFLSIGGTWTNASDVNRKHFFLPVSGEEVLEKVASLPIQTWSYKDDKETVRHMGPTAQDFHQAFGLGDTDLAIATVDADGVSLAAIQALAMRTQQLREENAALRSTLAEVQQRLSRLEARR